MNINLNCGCRIRATQVTGDPNPQIEEFPCVLHQNAERLLGFVRKSKSKEAQAIIDDIADVRQWLVNDTKPTADEDVIRLALELLGGYGHTRNEVIGPLIDRLSEVGLIDMVTADGADQQMKMYKEFFDKVYPAITKLYGPRSISGDQFAREMAAIDLDTALIEWQTKYQDE